METGPLQQSRDTAAPAQQLPQITRDRAAVQQLPDRVFQNTAALMEPLRHDRSERPPEPLRDIAEAVQQLRERDAPVERLPQDRSVRLPERLRERGRPVELLRERGRALEQLRHGRSVREPEWVREWVREIGPTGARRLVERAIEQHLREQGTSEEHFREGAARVERAIEQHLREQAAFLEVQNRGTSEEHFREGAARVEQLQVITISEEHISDRSSITSSCPICHVDFQLGENVSQMPCGHIFHTHCISTWLLSGDTCPVCRRPSNMST